MSAEVPSQVPLHVVPKPVQALRDPCGWPLVTFVQVPCDPATSHASHWKPHELLQQ